MRRETATAWRNGGPFLLHYYYMYSGVRSDRKKHHNEYSLEWWHKKQADKELREVV